MPACCPDSSRLPAQRARKKESVQNSKSSVKKHKKHQHIFIVTLLADEQSANEARVVVFDHILMGDVGVGKTGGVIFLRSNI